MLTSLNPIATTCSSWPGWAGIKHLFTLYAPTRHNFVEKKSSYVHYLVVILTLRQDSMPLQVPSQIHVTHWETHHILAIRHQMVQIGSAFSQQHTMKASFLLTISHTMEQLWTQTLYRLTCPQHHLWNSKFRTISFRNMVTSPLSHLGRLMTVSLPSSLVSTILKTHIHRRTRVSYRTAYLSNMPGF